MRDSNLPNYRHPSYNSKIQDWQLVLDVWEGIGDQKYKYLPKEQGEPGEAYVERMARSRFDNRFKPAINGHAGLLTNFTLKPETAQSIRDSIDNVDMMGGDLYSFWQEADKLALRDDACVILVEMPKADAEIKSQADFLNSDRKPYFVLVDIRNVVNWRINYYLGRAVIDQLVIREFATENEGVYGVVETEQYRVYRPGFFELYKLVKSEEGGGFQLVEEGEILDASGSPLPNVPAVWYGSSGKAMSLGKPPFLTLAELNIEHFQKRTNLAEVLRKCNLPVPTAEFDQMEGGRPTNLTIGPNTVVWMPKGCDFRFVEPSGSAIAATQSDIEKLEAAMDRISLAFLNGGEVQRTATEAVLDSVQTASNLTGMARLKASAMQTAFTYWTAYTGETEVGGVDMNKHLLNMPMTPENIRVIKDLATEHWISHQDFLELLKRGKVLPEDFDVMGALERSKPSGNEERYRQAQIYDLLLKHQVVFPETVAKAIATGLPIEQVIASQEREYDRQSIVQFPEGQARIPPDAQSRGESSF